MTISHTVEAFIEVDQASVGVSVLLFILRLSKVIGFECS